MRWTLAVTVLGLAALNLDAGRAPQNDPVTIRVDTAVKRGPMHPFWAWFGHDEPNYTYTANGKKLLSALQDLSPVPVFVRTAAEMADVAARNPFKDDKPSRVMA